MIIRISSSDMVPVKAICNWAGISIKEFSEYTQIKKIYVIRSYYSHLTSS